MCCTERVGSLFRIIDELDHNTQMSRKRLPTLYVAASPNWKLIEL